MGHVSSKEFGTAPLLVDLLGVKGQVDRLLTVAMTAENFPSATDPLFQKFVQLRADPSVLHWFNVQDPSRRGVLPPAPSAEELYQEHVTSVCSSNKEEDEKGVENHPVPILVFRVGGTFTQSRVDLRGQPRPHQDCSSPPSTISIVEAGLPQEWQDIRHKIDAGIPFREMIGSSSAQTELELVGFFSCTTACSVKSTPASFDISVLLDRCFWNESKSLSIFQVAVACFERFAAAAASGAERVAAPHAPAVRGTALARWIEQIGRLQTTTLETNLPTLRLFQQIFRRHRTTTLCGGQTAQTEVAEVVVSVSKHPKVGLPPESISRDGSLALVVPKELTLSVEAGADLWSVVEQLLADVQPTLSPSCFTLMAQPGLAVADPISMSQPTSGLIPSSDAGSLDGFIAEAKIRWVESNALVERIRRKAAVEKGDKKRHKKPKQQRRVVGGSDQHLHAIVDPRENSSSPHPSQASGSSSQGNTATLGSPHSPTLEGPNERSSNTLSVPPAAAAAAVLARGPIAVAKTGAQNTVKEARRHSSHPAAGFAVRTFPPTCVPQQPHAAMQPSLRPQHQQHCTFAIPQPSAAVAFSPSVPSYDRTSLGNVSEHISMSNFQGPGGLPAGPVQMPMMVNLPYGTPVSIVIPATQHHQPPTVLPVRWFESNCPLRVCSSLHPPREPGTLLLEPLLHKSHQLHPLAGSTATTSSAAAPAVGFPSPGLVTYTSRLSVIMADSSQCGADSVVTLQIPCPPLSVMIGQGDETGGAACFVQVPPGTQVTVM